MNDLSLVLNLRAAEARLAGEAKIALQSLGVTWPQALLLMDLHANGAKSQNALGRAINMDPATTKGVVQRLERQCVINRRPDAKDRRCLIVELTPSGIRVASQTKAALEAWAEQMLAQVSDTQRVALKRILGNLAGVLDAAA